MMKLRQLFMATLIAHATAACVSTAKPLDIGLPAKAYNSIANAFYTRPTTVGLGEFGGENHLDIRMDDYGDDAVIYVYTSTAKNVIAGIDKFLEWEAMATRDGDLLSKQIPVPDSDSAMAPNPCMRFHSAVVGEYYLALSVTCSDLVSIPTIYLDNQGALQLKTIVQKFSAGALMATDTSKYN